MEHNLSNILSYRRVFGCKIVINKDSRLKTREHQGTLYSILSLVEHQGTLYSIISLVEHQGTLYSILSLVEHQGTLYSIVSLVEHQGTLYSIISLVEHQGTLYSIVSLVEHQICSPYPEFVLTGVLSIKKVLKEQKSVSINRNFVLTVLG